jgi:hypothetical protein
MMPSQAERKIIENDIDDRIRDRLHQWARDSLELYFMAGLDPRDAIASISATLLYEYIHIAKTVVGVPREAVVELFKKAYDAMSDDDAG